MKISSLRWFNTTSKAITWFVILNGEIQIYLCYWLAFVQRSSVLENLGKTVVSEIVAPLSLLLVTRLLGHIFYREDSAGVKSITGQTKADSVQSAERNGDL